MNQCLTCSEANACLTCKDSEHRNLPDCECQEGFYDDNGVCTLYVVCSEMLFDDNSIVGDCRKCDISCRVCAEEKSQKCYPDCYGDCE